MTLAENFSRGYNQGLTQKVQEFNMRLRAQEFESNLRQANFKEYKDRFEVNKNTLQNIYDQYGEEEFERAKEQLQSDPQTREIYERAGMNIDDIGFNVTKGKVQSVLYKQVTKDNIDEIRKKIPGAQLEDTFKFVDNGKDLLIEELSPTELSKFSGTGSDFKGSKKYIAQSLTSEYRALAKEYSEFQDEDTKTRMEEILKELRELSGESTKPDPGDTGGGDNPGKKTQRFRIDPKTGGLVAVENSPIEQTVAFEDTLGNFFTRINFPPGY